MQVKQVQDVMEFRTMVLGPAGDFLPPGSNTVGSFQTWSNSKVEPRCIALCAVLSAAADCSCQRMLTNPCVACSHDMTSYPQPPPLQLQATVIGSSTGDGLLRCVFILPEGQHVQLQTAEQYEAFMAETFPSLPLEAIKVQGVGARQGAGCALYSCLHHGSLCSVPRQRHPAAFLRPCPAASLQRAAPQLVESPISNGGTLTTCSKLASKRAVIIGGERQGCCHAAYVPCHLPCCTSVAHSSVDF